MILPSTMTEHFAEQVQSWNIVNGVERKKHARSRFINHYFNCRIFLLNFWYSLLIVERFLRWGITRNRNLTHVFLAGHTGHRLTGYTLLAIIFHQQVRRSLLCFLILENHSTQIERNLFNVSKWINFSLPILLLEAIHRVYCRRWVLCVERKRRALWMVTVRNNLSVTFHRQDPHINHQYDCRIVLQQKKAHSRTLLSITSQWRLWEEDKCQKLLWSRERHQT